MGSSAILLAITALAGALGGIHVPINGALGARIGSTVVATLTFYGVAFTAIVLLAALTREGAALRALGDTPLWLLIVPGLISVAVVGSNTFLIPRLGAVNVFVVTLLAQTCVRMVISHFGWLESPVDPITLPKIAGAAMVAAGAVIVVRS